ncbi:hypothetical protein BCM18_005793 [Clostridium beijerinckii]|nr:DUF1778 domain-containing protein [Clostridium beijerinckii]MBA8937831.1 hypothetical protein [Clostridium beijerinckii]
MSQIKRRVGTIAIKNAEIKIRVTKEQKELFKKIAKAENMSMSEFIIVTTEYLARKKDENMKSKDMIERRAAKTEEKIMKLKKKLNKNR